MRTQSQVTAHTSARQAARMLPRSLTIDDATLHMASERTAQSAFWGPDARRYEARWRVGSTVGQAYVEIRPASRHSSQVVVGLGAPTGLRGKLVWSRKAMSRLALQFARGLRYEIETRGAERTTPFVSRQTTTELVRQRSA